MAESNYLYPLSIQLALPEGYRTDPDFRAHLGLLKNYGFSGVELNIINPDHVDADDLKEFLNDYGLKLTMFASGAAARAFNLSLSHEKEEIRVKSVQKCIDMINFSKPFGAGLILGFIKGGPCQDSSRARALFAESLKLIAPHALSNKVPVLVEATNRYESSVANSLLDASGLIENLPAEYMLLLPDTFHMNIEESSMYSALERYASSYNSIHVSDNNRYFPGLGAIRFGELIKFLQEIDYRGGLAIEGNIKISFAHDLKASMEYLTPLLS